MTFALPALLLTLIAPARADTIVLEEGQALLWHHRPEVKLVVDSTPRLRLLVTSRDPQFFSHRVLTLFPTSAPGDSALATVLSDSSTIDARSDTHLHTLWFPLRREQLVAWASGQAPTLRVGGVTVKFDDLGRRRLRAVVAGQKPPRE